MSATDSLPLAVSYKARMTDPYAFDSLAYLREHYADIREQRVSYYMRCLHDLFQGLKHQGELKILDYGSGPVIQNSISAAGFATEIVFCDISYSNRETTQKWLDGDASGLDWSPHFDYVVKSLEGKGEKEAREREQRMRQVSKVVYCDALSDAPMEKGYEGPYDVILQCGCLEGACTDKSTFDNAMKVLCTLLKPGGVLVDVSTEADVDSEGLSYRVGGKDHPRVSFTHQYIVSLMKECGLMDIKAEYVPLDPGSNFPNVVSNSPIGFHKVTGRKP